MWIVVAAWVAATLVFCTFFMKTMIPLRIVAIASNLAFITYALLGLHYGVFGRLYPILVLHSCLLPLNVLRLRELQRLIAAVRGSSDADALHALVQYMKGEEHPGGEVLFRAGDAPDKLYVIHSGHVDFPELRKRFSVGDVFGEIGLFAPHQVRTVTAICADDCRLATITGDKVLELYYENPKFGLFLIRLVSGYVRRAARSGKRGSRKDFSGSLKAGIRSKAYTTRAVDGT
jgi:CRP/FNR family transcriptional regulator, cyclic AMP receptor protein